MKDNYKKPAKHLKKNKAWYKQQQDARIIKIQTIFNIGQSINS